MPGDFLAEYDPAFGKIVGCHFDMNAVANNRPNAMPPHLARRVGDNPAVIVEEHPKQTVRQDLVNDAFDRKQIFLGHKPLVLVCRDALSGQHVASWRYGGRARNAPETVDSGW
jgi:hypothetical protein